MFPKCETLVAHDFLNPNGLEHNEITARNTQSFTLVLLVLYLLCMGKAKYNTQINM